MTRTLYDKLVDSHKVYDLPDSNMLIYVDFHIKTLVAFKNFIKTICFYNKPIFARYLAMEKSILTRMFN